jgi:hypothetical protein
VIGLFFLFLGLKKLNRFSFVAAHFLSIRRTLAGLIFAILLKLIVFRFSSHSKPSVSNLDTDITGLTLKDTYEIRAMTVVQALPEEIAQILVDHTKRMLWDLNSTQVAKAGSGDNLRVTYEKVCLGKKPVTNVDVKYSFAETFMNGHTTYLI